MAKVFAGRYEVLSSLGRGGMGEVFLANDLWLQRRVAVKQILGSTAGSEPDPVAVERLMREARAGAGVHHPNVVAVHDLVADEGQVLIVMEYLQARSLAEIVRARGRLDPLAACNIGVQVAAGLEAAHRVGVVHRDVKPANVLVDDAGLAKLADFGVARAPGDSQLTGTGMMIGSVAFMAPEVARGDLAGSESDVYSLGATLFTAVEGHPPFADDVVTPGSLRMLSRLITLPAPPAAHGGPLTEAVSRMMAGDPTQRPTAGEVQRALATLIADQTLPTHLPGLPVRVGPPAQPKDQRDLTDPVQTAAGLTDDETVDRVTLGFARPTPRGSGSIQPGDPDESPSGRARAAAVSERSANDAETRHRSSVATGATVLWATPTGNPTPSTAIAAMDGARPAESTARRKLKAGIVLAAVAGTVLVAGFAAVVVSNSLTSAGSFSSITSPPATETAGSLPSSTSPQATAAATGQASTPHVIDTIKVGKSPGSVAVDPQEHRAFVTNSDSNSVSVIDTTGNLVIASVEVGTLLADVAVDPQTHLAYVTNGSTFMGTDLELFNDSVMTIEFVGGTYDTYDFWSLGWSPESVAVDPQERRAYVTNSERNKVGVINTTTGTVTATIKVGNAPTDVEVDSQAQRAYVANFDDDTVSVIDTTTDKVNATINVGGSPSCVAVDPQTHLVYVTNTDRNTVSVIDTTAGKVNATIKVGKGPSGVAVDPQTHRVYVPNIDSNTVSVIDTITSKVNATIKVGKGPSGVAADPQTHRVYVTNDDSSTVSVIQG